MLRLGIFSGPACGFLARGLTGPWLNCSVCVVASDPAGRLPASADGLRAAFGQYASATGWRWRIRVRALHAREADALTGTAAVVRIDLTAADARVLAGLLRDAADPAEGTGPRGPIGLWIGSDDAAARVGVQPSTIRGWVARRGPKAHPFPPPEARYRGRNYWQKTTIDTWKAEQRRLDQQHRAKVARARPR
jgi:hypothetical protein